ncbi:hypothetical protein, partial [Staphylococcus sp. 775]|uniref:hypothetical protein n=1 Tax=Staphylococcus sp. 775 TaxID=2608391 RepID=UPI001CB76032
SGSVTFIPDSRKIHNLRAIISQLSSKSFERQAGGNAANPQELTPVSDWDKRGMPTHLSLEG